MAEKLKWLRFIIGEEAWETFSKSDEFQSALLVLLLTLLGSVLTALWRLGRWWLRRRREEQLKRDLHPYYVASDIRNATQYYVPTYFQSNAPSQENEPMQSLKVTARQKLIPFFLREAFRPGLNDQRFYIILAGSGMGKTTFMINLYLRYLQWRRFRGGKFDIRLMPLGYPNLLERIDAIPHQPDTILLLDGLDEDAKAVHNHKARLEEILRHVQDFRVVVFTCRTQFFPSEEEEPRETGIVKFGSKQGFQTMAKLYLSPFNEADIARYLRKKYSWWQYKQKSRARKIIDRSPSLMVRPMILSYIDDLLEDSSTSYDYTAHIYRTMIDKWIGRESDRVAVERRPRFREELYRFSREIALDMYRNRKHRRGLFIGQKEIRPFAEQHHIELDEIEMQSRSLLNRDVLGQYKFAHKSILEYFLAAKAVDDPSFAAQFQFDGMDQARVFYHELGLTQVTQPFLEGKRGEARARVDDGPERDVAALSPQDLKQITELHFASLKTLEPLRPLARLHSLHAAHTQVRDLGPLADLADLRNLHLSHTQVGHLGPLEKCLSLHSLQLDHTQATDLAPLRNLRELRHLSVAHTPVESLDPLTGLHLLETLSIHHTRARDLSPLRKMKSLHTLLCNNTPITGLAPLRDLAALRQLSCNATRINNISPLRGLSALEKLSLSYTDVDNLRPLKDLPNLSHLALDQTPIQDLAPLDGLPQLQTLSLRRTALTHLAALTHLPALRSLHLDQTMIKDIAPLAAFPSLEELTLARLSPRSIAVLQELPNLRLLVLSQELAAAREVLALRDALPACQITFK
ncbi:MAG: hypothetical protein OHK0039_06230 [Bacteroidia bacterium]